MRRSCINGISEVNVSYQTPRPASRRSATLRISSHDGRSTGAAGHIRIKDVQPGNRLIVTESYASDEIASLERQWCAGDGQFAGANGVSVSATLEGPSRPRKVGPRLGKPFLSEAGAHRVIKTRADFSPPTMSMIIDDRSGQFDGTRKWAGVHDFSVPRVYWLAVSLENGLTRDAEHLADFLPRPARLSRLLHSCSHQRLSPVPNLVRSTHQVERIALAAQNWGSKDLSELPAKLLTG